MHVESTSPPRTHLLEARLAFGAAIVAALLTIFWPRPGADAPDETTAGGFLVDGEGRPAPLGPLLAPVTLVHFWATWCPPCIDEIPTLKRLEQAYTDDPRFRVIYVAVQEDPEQVGSFLGQSAAQRVLYDPRWQVAHRFGTEKLPETHLLVEGDPIESYIGAQNWDDERLRADIERALAEV